MVKVIIFVFYLLGFISILFSLIIIAKLLLLVLLLIIIIIIIITLLSLFVCCVLCNFNDIFKKKSAVAYLAFYFNMGPGNVAVVMVTTNEKSKYYNLMSCDTMRLP